MKCPNMICSQKQRWSYSNHLWYESKFLGFINSLHFFAHFLMYVRIWLEVSFLINPPHCIVQLIWQHVSREKNEKGKEEKPRHQRVSQLAPISQRATEMTAGKRKGKQLSPGSCSLWSSARPWSVYALEFMSAWVSIEWFFRCLKAWHWKYLYMEIKCYSETEQDTI